MIGRALHAWAGGLPRAFWALFAGTLINRVGTFVEPFVALYLTSSRGVSVPTAGAVVAGIGAGSIVSQPLGGALADRIGRRPTLCGGMLASAVAITALALARPVWLLAAAAVFVGVTGNLYRPASQATIADLVPLGDRRRATGLIFWAVNLGFSVAAVGGGFLAQRGYGVLFAIDALTCVGCAAVVWRLVPETRPAAASEHDAAGWSQVLADHVALAYFALNLVVAMVYASTFTLMPLAMHGDGLGPATYGAVIAANGIGIVALQPVLAGPLLRRRPATMLALGTALTAVAMVVVAASDGAAGYALGIMFITLGEICNATTGPGLVAEIAPAALRGRYAGAYGLTWGLAFTITPLVGGALLGEGGGAATPWLAAAALSGATGAGLLALGPAIEARRARARQPVTF